MKKEEMKFREVQFYLLIRERLKVLAKIGFLNYQWM
jgi:hypothetical protein